MFEHMAYQRNKMLHQEMLEAAKMQALLKRSQTNPPRYPAYWIAKLGDLLITLGCRLKAQPHCPITLTDPTAHAH
jgi:hypothetical protein